MTFVLIPFCISILVSIPANLMLNFNTLADALVPLGYFFIRKCIPHFDNSIQE